MPIGGGQTDPPLCPAGISQGLLTVQVIVLMITIMMKNEIFFVCKIVPTWIISRTSNDMGKLRQGCLNCIKLPEVR